jgi:hypothetical protein
VARRSPDNYGFKYQCDEHPWYALNLGEHKLLEIYFQKNPEDKKKFIDWLKDNPPEGDDKFREITRSDIERILRIKLTNK